MFSKGIDVLEVLEMLDVLDTLDARRSTLIAQRSSLDAHRSTLLRELDVVDVAEDEFPVVVVALPDAGEVELTGGDGLVGKVAVGGGVDLVALCELVEVERHAGLRACIGFVGPGLLAVNTLGVLYIVENGNTVNSLNDLEGKTVYIPGLGSNPEYVLNIMLKKAGLEGKVTVDGTTYGTPDALSAAVTAGTAPLALLPEPKVTAATMGRPSLHVAINCTEVWKNLTSVDLVQGCLIARNKFIVDHEALTKDFLKGYKASVDTVNNDPEAASLIVAAGLAPKEALVKAALPRCNIVYMTGKEMEDSLTSFWTSLYETAPTSVGGAIPDSTIFYK